MYPNIPWYKSNTLRALLVALIAQVLVWFGVADLLPAEQLEQFVDMGLKVTEVVAILAAGITRARQPTPPVTMKPTEEYKQAKAEMKQQK